MKILFPKKAAKWPTAIFVGLTKRPHGKKKSFIMPARRGVLKNISSTAYWSNYVYGVLLVNLIDPRIFIYLEVNPF